MTLDKIRATSKNIFFKLFLIIIVISFAIWGLGDIFSKSSTTIASVNNEPISIYEYYKARDTEINHIKSMIGKAPTEALLKQLDVNRLALSKIIDQKLLAVIIKDLGLRIDNRIIVKEIQSQPMFKDENKEFNKDKFFHILRNNNISESEYIAMLKNELAADYLNKSITSVPIKNPILDKFLYRYFKEQADINLIAISAKEYKYSPTDEEITEYYQKHQNNFQSPEYRKLQYISFSADHVSSIISVTEEEIKQEYEDNHDSSKITKEEVKRQLLKSKAEEAFFELAQKVDDELASGSSMEEIAKKFNFKVNIIEAIDKNGMNKNLQPITLPKLDNFLTIAFNTSPKSDSSLSASNNDTEYFLIHVADLIPSKIKYLTEVSEQIKKIIINNKQQENLVNFTTKLREELVKTPSNLKQIVNRNPDFNITINDHKIVSRLTNSDKLPNEFVENLFKLNNGEVSNYIKLDDKNYIIAILNKIDMPQQTDNSMKEKITQEIRANSINSLSQEFMNFLYTKYKVEVYKNLSAEID